MFYGQKKVVVLHSETIVTTLQSNKWIVVNTQPHKEIYAAENLSRQGFSVYCPMISKRIRHARKAYNASRPMFPSYVFVDYGAKTSSWRPILSTYGVRTIIKTCDAPGFLDGSFIDALRQREIDGTVCKPAHAHKLGDNVAIQGGALDGLIGEIIEMRGRDRVVVLLDLLNGAIPAQVSVSGVRAVSA